MDRSYPYTRRRVGRARAQQRVLAALMLGLAGATLGFVLMGEPDPAAAAGAAPPLPAPTAASTDSAPAMAARRVYRYSIVPGGAATRTELAQVIRTDKVVAAHYASFDVDRARAVTVARPRAVHVSYRKGDKVYWTANKVMLAKGETLLSDGSNEMRARCANRISDLARFPVEADGPSAEVLDTVYEEGGEGDPAFALVNGDGDGVPRHIVAGMQGPAYVSGGNASGMPAAVNAGMGGSNGMRLARSGASGSLDGLRHPATAAPAPPGAVPPEPVLSTGTPGAPPAPSPEAASPGGALAPGAPPPVGGATGERPPASGDSAAGSTGGGGGADPIAGDAGTTPKPFIPEPSLAPPGPADGGSAEKPAAGEVPEPPVSWLLGAALAGMAVLRRRPPPGPARNP